MILGSAARRAAASFALVLLRRHLGLTDAALVITTVATYGGGLVSLDGWGRLADRIGTGRVLRWTSATGALATLGPIGLPYTGAATLAVATLLFFTASVATSGFEVADTNLLFRIAPSEDPTAMLVAASVTVSALTGLAPSLAGVALEAALAAGGSPAASHGALFALCAALQLAALAPLRGSMGAR